MKEYLNGDDVNDNVIVVTCGQMANDIINLVNEQNKSFKENHNHTNLLVHRVLIYTYSIDMNLKLMEQNKDIVHDVVYYFIDLINGIKEAISDLETKKCPENLKQN